MAEFEIGLVYKKNSRYFIAVSPTSLVGCKAGQMSEIKPSTAYDTVRSVAVETICESWGIEIGMFDTLMAEFLAPPQTALKTRPRGTRRAKPTEDDYWRSYRTGKITRSKS